MGKLASFIQERIPLIYVFLSGIGFSLQTLFIRMLVERGFRGSFYCVFCRGLVQMVIVSFFIYFDDDRAKGLGPNLFGNSWRVKWILFLRSFTGYGSIACAFLAAEYMSIGDSTVLVMMSPLIAAFLSFWILGEPWRIPEFIGTVLSVIGAVLVIKPPFLFGHSVTQNSKVDDGSFFTGVFFALTSAVCAAFAFIFIRILGTTAKMPWANVCFAQAIGQLALSPPSLYLYGEHFEYKLPLVDYILIFSGGFIGAWSQIAMTLGMQREKSATATAMRMSDVLFGFIWQLAFTSDHASVYSVIGAMLVTCSILIIVVLKEPADSIPTESEESSVEMIGQNQLEAPVTEEQSEFQPPNHKFFSNNGISLFANSDISYQPVSQGESDVDAA
jgi:drug/metabolite transporter (DMT)-like permease